MFFMFVGEETKSFTKFAVANELIKNAQFFFNVERRKF